MRISEVANITGLSVSNIRFYEKKGLLAPARETESKYRDYSEEDVEQLKRIILYRKINLPIETIFLLKNREISMETVLKRQEAELKAQQEMLQGSMDLCRRLLEIEDFDKLDVDYYLNYVKEEEEKGTRFAEAEELLEDFAEFTGLTSLRWDPLFGFLWNARVLRGIVLIILVVTLGAAARDAFLVFQGKELTWKLFFWMLWFGGLIYAFYRFRRAKKVGRGK